MDWKALPYSDYDGERKKRQLSARLKVSAIPTVVLFHRDPQPGRTGEWTLMPSGRDGVRLLTQPADDVVALFPSWKAQQLVLEFKPTTRAKCERCASVVILCEHLDEKSAQFAALLAAMNSVVRAYGDELAARKRAREVERQRAAKTATPRGTAAADEETWPNGGTGLLFFIAPGPPNEATRSLRRQANLPAATTGEETLAPLLLDLRTRSDWQACYAMRGVCEIEGRPPPTVAGLCEENGKRLTTFVESFCNKIQTIKAFDPAVAYLNPRVCTPMEPKDVPSVE